MCLVIQKRVVCVSSGTNLFVFCSLGGTQFCCYCVVYDTKIGAKVQKINELCKSFEKIKTNKCYIFEKIKSTTDAST